ALCEKQVTLSGALVSAQAPPGSAVAAHATLPYDPSYTAPTETAFGTQAGSASPVFEPLLPAATIVRMPALNALLIAVLNTLPDHCVLWLVVSRRLRLIATMLSEARIEIAELIADRMSDASALEPLNTLNIASFAPGATPRAIAETFVPCSVGVMLPG